MLTELLNNAIEFSKHGGVIRVQAEENDDFAHISVTDTGCGIPDAELESIFAPFHLSSRTDTGAGGQGLGLAICHQIVIGHGGTISAKNNPEKGASFLFTIPLKNQRH